ncbi:potassium voltage-gated channel subfamily S member 2-like isoform X2 [Hypomesus transpacificus]|uniref:potassium voltage-gated channel subfamily S member 2-like isoform X2 n=1 Tax=Hypomesus transpacificus TaxID=137520 RepID=UPI001F084E21|nr:potassium voltage-gated channel subfamily S member 2-like isoform X2 [Hypomesus transpacificus]
MTGQSLEELSGAYEDNAIRINVGGFKKRLLSNMLSRFPETRLARLLLCQSKESILELCDDYDDTEKEFYFDRNPALFPYVLNFYNTGRLHVMAELCIFSFSQEIEYWGINEFFIDSCCSNAYHCRKMDTDCNDWDGSEDGGSTTSSFDEILEFYNDATKFDKQPLGSARRRIWLMLDNPGYSIASRVISILSILVVLGSIATMCMNSMTEFSSRDSEGQLLEDPRFETVEYFGIGWFTFELVTRFTVAPDLVHFFEHPLNLIDLVSILPFYLTLVINLVAESSPALANLGRVAQVLRLTRIFRILKLARHSTGLRSLGATLKNSYKEVGLLLLYLAVGVSFFSVMAYTVEKEDSEDLSTIPACWWWATRQKQLEIAMRSCDFDEGIKEVPPSVNLRNYYAHKVKSFMASLSNMSRSSPSEHSLNESIH